ncbi:hypothetical protein AOC36_11270 [Erysipelothrix larvae]|uniref:Acylphosphatase n=1 Tax=Erysipelothrix larvae TaxID=1514105 RepID=A0A109UHP3_9FIRM|nr:acylphosphatase [Erysipelothrix larvae]AMC94530.1 hypothetical protein AOC36_11270 [Erysipelothrix larvae]
MITLQLNVYGFVQGVGFRFFTQRLADSYGDLTGFVKNEMDGSVTIEVRGPKQSVMKFVEDVKRSPAPSGHVDRVSITEIVDEKSYNGFKVIGY